MSKRSEIEGLQTMLQNLVSNSSQKKIDVEDLKRQLADGMRGRTKASANTSSSALDISNSLSMAVTKKANAAAKNSRSKSPGQGLGYNSSSLNEDLIPEKGSAAKMDRTEPSWYKALKKKL